MRHEAPNKEAMRHASWPREFLFYKPQTESFEHSAIVSPRHPHRWLFIKLFRTHPFPARLALGQGPYSRYKERSERDNLLEGPWRHSDRGERGRGGDIRAVHLPVKWRAYNLLSQGETWGKPVKVTPLTSDTRYRIRFRVSGSKY